MTPLDEILRVDLAEPRLTRLQECQLDRDRVASCLAKLKEGVRTFDAVDNEPLTDTTDKTIERPTRRLADLEKRLDWGTVDRITEQRHSTLRVLH